jgi:AcrR family transcriptional regulator
LGSKERRQRERIEVRTRILDAARQMLASEGHDAVTMRRIADRIEYSPTAIYFHFKDKSALIRELCDHDFQQLAQKFASIARIADPIEKLRRAGQLYLHFGLENPNHYRVMFMMPHPDGGAEREVYTFLKSIVGEAIAHRLFRKELDDVDLVAQTVWAGVHGVVALQIAKSNDAALQWAPFNDRAEAMIELLIDGLI